MATELPETKKKGADVIEVNTQDKDFFSKVVKVREMERTGKLDPDLNLTVVDTTDIFLPVGH